jgi:hypothetical protein
MKQLILPGQPPHLHLPPVTLPIHQLNPVCLRNCHQRTNQLREIRMIGELIQIIGIGIRILDLHQSLGTITSEISGYHGIRRESQLDSLTSNFPFEVTTLLNMSILCMIKKKKKKKLND